MLIQVQIRVTQSHGQRSAERLVADVEHGAEAALQKFRKRNSQSYLKEKQTEIQSLTSTICSLTQLLMIDSKFIFSM